METLFLTIVNMSLTASYVIAIVLLVRLLFKRAPKRYAYLLWAVVLFRLVCPVALSSELSVFNLPSFDMRVAQQESDVALSYIPPEIGTVEQPKITIGIPAMNTQINDSLLADTSGTSGTSSTPVASAHPMQLALALATAVWGIGAALLLSYGAIAYWRLHRRLATAVRLEPGVYESDRISSPFILGLFRPRIYLPFDLEASARAYVLRHERCHLRRGDHLIKAAAFLVLALHWFNPLVWIAFGRMTRDMEMSCDERVLAESGPGSAQAYSACLLALATDRRLPAAGPLAFGESVIGERVRNALRYRQPRRSLVAAFAVLCALVIAACATNPAASSSSGGEERSDLYGSYRFHSQVYMHPLSSAFAGEGYEAQYVLSEHALILADDVRRQDVEIEWQDGQLIDEQTFRDDFGPLSEVGVPELPPYGELYRYVLKEAGATPGYALYLVGDAVWLAELRELEAPERKFRTIWSIFELTRQEEQPVQEVQPHSLVIRGDTQDIDEFMAAQGPFESGYADDTPYNITSTAIREASDYRIFKYDVSSASFLLHGGAAHPLEPWLGGFGVTSMALADLNGDGQQEFYYTYSWGSGMHRSQIGYYDPATGQMETLAYELQQQEMMVTASPDGGLTIWRAKLAPDSRFVDYTMTATELLGRLVYVDGTVELRAEAPDSDHS
ncbi:hypothetical protein PA598K_02147 [Paenibacillus sp. 598K]|uniref:M56 family metallopeptidase n=1 Tax=Paenibacillus sp. 598K TaxID=1117987 RepID=UPI000FF99BB8|nr:M56 family metallopeptidase [Paenibacillus sp. 598K]GBF73825.1 hypothetical protein PA598K_02147 [Paenibacillus sp. 598K]